MSDTAVDPSSGPTAPRSLHCERGPHRLGAGAGCGGSHPDRQRERLVHPPRRGRRHTEFAKPDAASDDLAGHHLAPRRPSTTTSTTISETVVQGGKTLARPKRIVAPTSAVDNATCLATPDHEGLPRTGVRLRDLNHRNRHAFGDYTGQVKDVRLYATGPGGTSSTALSVATVPIRHQRAVAPAVEPETEPRHPDAVLLRRIRTSRPIPRRPPSSHGPSPTARPVTRRGRRGRNAA